jgi:uncharacterized membrane protein
MSELIVVGFKGDMYRAAQVLTKLRSLEERWAVDLTDALAIYRDYSGELRLDSSYQLTMGDRAGFGMVLGSLVGALFALPFTAGASAAAAAAAMAAGTAGGGLLGAATGVVDAKWWREDFGISEDFVREVGATVEPGDSAIFALLRSADPEVVAKQFAGYGGKVLRSSLTQEQKVKLEGVLDAARAPA